MTATLNFNFFEHGSDVIKEESPYKPETTLLCVHLCLRKLIALNIAPKDLGDTWGIPGGARDSHESTIEAAFREAVEETGIDTDLLTLLHTFTDNHGDWRYETVIAQAADGLIAHEVNDESQEVRWVEISKVGQLNLHPSFKNSWPELMKLLNNLIGPS